MAEGGGEASAEDLKDWWYMVSAQTALLEDHSAGRWWRGKKTSAEDLKGGWQRDKKKKASAEDLKDWGFQLQLLFRKMIQEDGRGEKDLSRGSAGLGVLAQTALLEDHSAGWQRERRTGCGSLYRRKSRRAEGLE